MIAEQYGTPLVDSFVLKGFFMPIRRKMFAAAAIAVVATSACSERTQETAGSTVESAEADIAENLDKAGQSIKEVGAEAKVELDGAADGAAQTLDAAGGAISEGASEAARGVSEGAAKLGEDLKPDRR